MAVVAAGRLAAHVPDRHRADRGLLGPARLAAQLRPRRDRAARRLEHRPADAPTAGATSLLPAVTLAVYQLTLVMRLVRAEMLEALRSDYVKFARARGLPDRVVHFGHALRNTLVPVLTISGLQLGGLIAFSIITETVFSWPGMGSLFIQAVQFPDVPVMAAYLCLIALVFVVDQPGRRPAVRGRRSAPARAGAARGGAPMRPRAPSTEARQRPPRRRRRRAGGACSPATSGSTSCIRRWPCSPRRSRCCACAARCSRRGSRRTTRSTSRRSTWPTRTCRRPGSADGRATYPLGTDDQGRDILSGAAVRRAHLADGGAVLGRRCRC